MLISVHNRTTSGEVNPSVFLTSAASAGVTDSLLYYAVIPPEGWKEFSIQNVDIRGRFTEITRLDVYGFETNGEPGLRCEHFYSSALVPDLLVNARQLFD